jgi:hypothetical protein
MARKPAPVQGPWTSEERAIFASLKSPGRIQAWLDETPYSTDPIYRSPRSVMRDRRAHCVDGAMFAACALRQLGQPPLILELRAERDDDHWIALFQRDACWGAVAKSNFVGLRFREPIFRTLRELVLSYFPGYYNLEHVMSLRAYSVPVNLTHLDRLDWMTRDEQLEELVDHVDRSRHYAVLTEAQRRQLEPTDERTYYGHMYGTDPAGVYDPAKH